MTDTQMSPELTIGEQIREKGLEQWDKIEPSREKKEIEAARGNLASLFGLDLGRAAEIEITPPRYEPTVDLGDGLILIWTSSGEDTHSLGWYLRESRVAKRGEIEWRWLGRVRYSHDLGRMLDRRPEWPKTEEEVVA